MRSETGWIESNGASVPYTVIESRYGGVYSGAKWVAIIGHEVPSGAWADDLTCSTFWMEYDNPRGGGRTKEKAVESLKANLQ